MKSDSGQTVNKEFCVKFGKIRSETWNMIKQAYKGEALSRDRVFEWHRMSRESRDSVQDDPRAGRPSTAHTDTNVERVRQLLQGYRRVAVRMISEEMNLNRDVYHKILREDLGKWKLN